MYVVYVKGVNNYLEDIQEVVEIMGYGKEGGENGLNSI